MKKRLQLHNTEPLWGESTSDGIIHLSFENSFHVMKSWYLGNGFSSRVNLGDTNDAHSLIAYDTAGFVQRDNLRACSGKPRKSYPDFDKKKSVYTTVNEWRFTHADTFYSLRTVRSNKK